MKPPPTVRLSNGLFVANFSSPHEFKFTDGSLLPACGTQRASLKLDVVETETPGIGESVDVILDIHTTEPVIEEVYRLQADSNIDIVLVPFMLMEAWKREAWDIGKLRVCRVADRTTKEIYHNKFCV